MGSKVILSLVVLLCMHHMCESKPAQMYQEETSYKKLKPLQPTSLDDMQGIFRNNEDAQRDEATSSFFWNNKSAKRDETISKIFWNNDKAQRDEAMAKSFVKPLTQDDSNSVSSEDMQDQPHRSQSNLRRTYSSQESQFARKNINNSGELLEKDVNHRLSFDLRKSSPSLSLEDNSDERRSHENRILKDN